MKESFGSVFWKVALSGLMDSAYKETKDQADASKTPEQESSAGGAWTVVQKRVTARAKVERELQLIKPSACFYRSLHGLQQRVLRVAAVFHKLPSYHLVPGPTLLRQYCLQEARER